MTDKPKRKLSFSMVVFAWSFLIFGLLGVLNYFHQLQIQAKHDGQLFEMYKEYVQSILLRFRPDFSTDIWQNPAVVCLGDGINALTASPLMVFAADSTFALSLIYILFALNILRRKSWARWGMLLLHIVLIPIHSKLTLEVFRYTQVMMTQCFKGIVSVDVSALQDTVELATISGIAVLYGLIVIYLSLPGVAAQFKSD